MDAQDRIKRLEENNKKMEKEIKALKKELKGDKKKAYEFPFFGEFPDGEVVFFKSGEGYSGGYRDGQGWAMEGGSNHFGCRFNVWAIDNTEPFNGALIVVDGKVTRVEKH